MKKFIIKTSFFVAPFLIFYFINAVFYRKNEGDLARLGYIYNNPSPSSEVAAQQKPLEKKYIRISETDLDQNIKADILTIGDSFSEQRLVGYQNMLANKGFSVVHVDRFLSEENPVQVLIELINSDFFDRIKTKYVVLETVERFAVERTSELSFTQSKSIDSIKPQIKKYEEKKLKSTNPDELQHHFDFIYGVQTDDNPTQALARFRQNEITKEEMLAEFRKPYSFKQLSIHNQSFCDIMKIEKVYQSKTGEELQKWQ